MNPLTGFFGIVAVALIVRGYVLIQTREVDKKFTGWLHVFLGGLIALLAVMVWILA